MNLTLNTDLMLLITNACALGGGISVFAIDGAEMVELSTLS